MRCDSFMLPRDGNQGFRLLITDEYLSFPVHVPVRVLVTSRDVIHS